MEDKYYIDGDLIGNKEEFIKYCEENEEIIEYDEAIIDTRYIHANVTNPENKQSTLWNCLVPEEDAEYLEARRQLTLTNQYYDWHHTVADRIYDNDDITQEDIEEYNDLVRKFNEYGDMETIELGAEHKDIVVNNNSSIF